MTGIISRSESRANTTRRGHDDKVGPSATGVTGPAKQIYMGADFPAPCVDNVVRLTWGIAYIHGQSLMTLIYIFQCTPRFQLYKFSVKLLNYSIYPAPSSGAEAKHRDRQSHTVTSETSPFL